MDYKLIPVLKTRHVEAWAEYMKVEKVIEHSQPKASVMTVKKAVECGWFEGKQPDVDDMIPSEVIQLATMIYQAYSACMGFDSKNLLAGQPITPKE
jgi:hypothetical protein